MHYPQLGKMIAKWMFEPRYARGQEETLTLIADAGKALQLDRRVDFDALESAILELNLPGFYDLYMELDTYSQIHIIKAIAVAYAQEVS